MFSDDFAYIGNYICRESIRNISRHLSEQEQENFSNHDYYYLTVMFHMDHPTFSQLANELKLTRSAISILFNKFHRMRLLEKEQSTSDKRSFHIHLTEKGRKIVQGDTQTYGKLTALIQRLIPDEGQMEEIEKLLSSIVISLKKETEE